MFPVPGVFRTDKLNIMNEIVASNQCFGCIESCMGDGMSQTGPFFF